MINKIFDYLENELASFSRNFQGFGYKERIQIERGLFLILKLLSAEKLRYNLQGFSKIHKDCILMEMQKIKCNGSFAQIIEHTYQLKVYIQTLSSESAYVRDDALTRLDLNRLTVVDFLVNEIQRLRHKINALNIEYTINPTERTGGTKGRC
jgi:hypothetical protein